MPADPGPVLHGFEPVADERCRVLILGSFPGRASLASGQYYAHPRNAFWPILSALLNEPLTALDWPQRYHRLLAHRIGLWDVYRNVRRHGSLDQSIREPTPAGLEALIARLPQLAVVLHNGRESARHADRLAALGLATHSLPSTSPAHARLRFDEKLEQWRAAVEPWRVDAGDAQ